MSATELYSALSHFIEISFKTDAFWIVLPLALSTLLIMAYFGIYREEKADWNTNFSNSLVLIFVSIALFRHIYDINNAGAFNFVNEWLKTLFTILLLGIGLFAVRFNFEHLLPIKVARYVNSPITVNLAAYAIILLVYSTEKITGLSILSLIILVLIIMAALILIKIPMHQLREYLENEKKRERLSNIKEEKFEISELKQQLKERKKELEVLQLKKLEKEEKEAKRLKKAIKKK